MNAAGQTICLNMIVKNEAPVIRRCLDSVRPIIDHWVIVDTGSADGTQDIIRDYLRDLPGELHERPWRDFAHNRTEALELARGKSDYTLIIDADDTLEIAPDTTLPALTADSYTIEIGDTATIYRRTQLVRSALPWRYEGVLHEYLTCEGADSSGHLSEIRMLRNHDGARRKDPETYRRDAAMLETALRTETNPFLISRYRFYLAQSYRDCGENAKALENYLVRAELGFWQEEVFISLYRAAQMKEQLAHPDQAVIDAYLRAADALPTRAEALHGASRFCRHKGRSEEGYQIAKRGLDLAMPSDALFVESWIYETGLLDEFAVNAYWSGHNRDCLDASLKILATGKLSGGDMQRVVANARAASERLPRDPNLGSLGTDSFIEQHTLVPPRSLRSIIVGSPRVLIAILAKQKERSLPLYLECIEALDYPKASIVLYIRTNNNTDETERLLREWVARVGHLYAGVEFDAEDVDTRVEQFGVHEWNATRFSVLGRIRNISLERVREHRCDFYFVSDVDNFVRPCTLRELMALNLPIVAPLLRSIAPGTFYSNYHAEIDATGYYKECDQYQWALNRWIRGVIEMPVVHCTYLIRADVLNDLNYQDGSSRHEYVIFSDGARKSGVPQYLDNRQVYGYISFDEDDPHYVVGGIERARTLLKADLCTCASFEGDVRNLTRNVIAKADGAKSDGPVSHTMSPKTLVFCTAFARTPDVWDIRYRRWIRAIQASSLHFDQIIIIDDGSSVLPEWEDVEILPAGSEVRSDKSILLFHFPDNLGRWRGHNYPGWYRSFAFAADYARRCGFDRVIHVESDSFLIGDSIATLFNNVKDEWIALWDSFFEMPETAVQVAHGTGLAAYYEATRQPYSDLVGQVIERVLPFTRLVKSFTGGKYPEFMNYVPASAEYVVQATENYPLSYFWWLEAHDERSLPTKSLDPEITEVGFAKVLAGQKGIHRVRISTGHDTIVYTDEATSELRHGPIASAPVNVNLIHDLNCGIIEYSVGGVGHFPALTATASHMHVQIDRKPSVMPMFLFKIIVLTDGRVGLRAGLRFLSADSNGAVSLSARECQEWERFSLLPDTSSDRIPCVNVAEPSGRSFPRKCPDQPSPG
jgi:hypothetical protein